MSNPVIGRSFERAASDEAVMTLGGTVNRALMLLAVLLIGAYYAWQETLGGGAERALDLARAVGLMWTGMLGGLVAFLVIMIAPRSSPIVAPIYAALEGLVIGAISVVMNARYPGIALQAAGLTLAAMLAILTLYRTGIIRVTPVFVNILMTAMVAIMVVYLATLVLSFWNIQIPYIHEGGTAGIVFSLVVVGVAAFSLALDFEMIKESIALGRPKWLEWYCAFGLMVTLIWLYLEILKLLAKMRRR